MSRFKHLTVFIDTTQLEGVRLNEGLMLDLDDHFSFAPNTRVFRILLWLREARAQLFQTEPDMFS